VRACVRACIHTYICTYLLAHVIKITKLASVLIMFKQLPHNQTPVYIFKIFLLLKNYAAL